MAPSSRQQSGASSSPEKVGRKQSRPTTASSVSTVSYQSPAPSVATQQEESVEEYPGPICVRNTFIDMQFGRPPSLDGFFMERLVRSAPVSRIEEFLQGPLPCADEDDEEAYAMMSGTPAIPPGELGTARMPTMGSAGHEEGTCRPCAFVWKERGCSSGSDCPFCHLCAPGEKKRRQKEKRLMWRGFDQMRRALQP